ncbi:hypothetical protein DFH06DRAFT_1216192 [Mycena polygramma]|nr:hypothetical protein DFH06DRAFT_1216192 [Mycena polygramma]
MGLPTPPDDVMHIGSPQTSPHGSPNIAHGGSGVAWPSLGTKKSVGSLASLAGKMWHRSRSKSNNSTVSSLSEASPPPPMPVLHIGLPSPPALKLDSTPFVIPPIETSPYDHDPDPSDSPTSSSTPTGAPLSRATAVPPPSSSPPMPTWNAKHTAPRPPALVLTTTSNSTSASLFPVPKPAPESRPVSWQSVSSTGSSSLAASPSIFDAFPSVPEMPPLPPPSRSRSLQVQSNGTSPTGSVRPLPASPPSYSVSDPSSTPTGSYGHGHDGLLARVAETQRSVNPL